MFVVVMRYFSQMQIDPRRAPRGAHSAQLEVAIEGTTDERGEIVMIGHPGDPGRVDQDSPQRKR